MLSRLDIDKMIVLAKMEIQTIMQEFTGGFENDQDLYGNQQRPELGTTGSNAGNFVGPIAQSEQWSDQPDQGNGADTSLGEPNPVQ
jgi:hypothetical protein